MSLAMMNSGLRQAEVMMAISLATDLGTGRPMEWAMRSTLLGIRLGEALGLSEQELREVYCCSLLIYIGCTSEVTLALHLFGDDPAAALASADLIDKGDPRQMLPWMLRHIGVGQPPLRRLRTLATAGSAITEHMIGHCEVAQYFAERLGFEESIRMAFSHMYERWDGQGEPRKLKGEEISRPMCVVLLVRAARPIHFCCGFSRMGSVSRRVSRRSWRAGDVVPSAVYRRIRKARRQVACRAGALLAASGRAS